MKRTILIAAVVQLSVFATCSALTCYETDSEVSRGTCIRYLSTDWTYIRAPLPPSSTREGRSHWSRIQRSWRSWSWFRILASISIFEFSISKDFKDNLLNNTKPTSTDRQRFREQTRLKLDQTTSFRLRLAYFFPTVALIYLSWSHVKINDGRILGRSPRAHQR